MKAFLDSSVLVASFNEQHVHHEPSFQLVRAQNKKTGCISAHSLAEVYSTLTGMPGKHRVSPDQVLLFLDSLRETLSVISIDADDYRLALESAASINIIGGAIYDALLGHIARKSKSEVIYTWNVKHFSRLAPEVSHLVRTP